MKRFSIVLSMIATFFVVGTAGSVVAGEYAIQRFGKMPDVASLEQAAAKGWRFVSIVPILAGEGAGGYMAYFASREAAPTKREMVAPSSGINCYYTSLGGYDGVEWFAEGEKPTEIDKAGWTSFECR
ncbi:hypothetical protein [Thalassospira xiamenensis]|uniref:hypothetical protein n=1 Tax=Thalassospira xiamenensis TaxID=220697 RepID=UPI001FFEC47E|nr:hypothetical protein [Thalassospira xiamenensis]MCK2169135.1 hypothetical protein [Thalassospira xiamenensis]